MNGLIKRCTRNKTALSLKEPDKIPFMPSMNNFYAMHYGLSIQDSMDDIENLIEPLGKYCEEYNPDWVWNSMPAPIRPMEILGHKQARWPGAYWNLPENTPYQYIDKSFIDEDEYEEYLSDPSGFILRKVLPEKFDALKGLAAWSPYANCSQHIMGFSAFAQPQVREALQAILDAGEALGKYIQGSMKLTKSIIDRGYPVYASMAAPTPFDDFADNIRGIMDLCVDILSCPDEVEMALEKMGNVTIPQTVKNCKITHQDNLFIPLHCGVDNFMSVENYEKFYWPGLKKLIMALIDADITPIVFCEGKYDTRLECITDIPKGKVIYNFEDVNLENAKRIIGPHAAIMGGMDTHILMSGTPEQVADETKRVIDILAPGGGFFMSNSLALDEISHENMHAWRETTEKYS